LGCGARLANAPAAAPQAPGDYALLAAATTPGSPETCSNAFDDNQNGLVDEGCGLASGLIQIVASWDAPRADVDLRVMDPNGELIEVGRVARSGLTKDRDCPGRSSECQGRNLENVYLTEGEPLKGEYRIRVRLEALGGDSAPVRVTLATRLGQKTQAQQWLLESPSAERELRLQL
jgi:tRNA (guanosine-2'-O-)-methyltransferase